jgi:hypothetical protein
MPRRTRKCEFSRATATTRNPTRSCFSSSATPARRGHDVTAENKYADQVNDACSILAARRSTARPVGQEITVASPSCWYNGQRATIREAETFAAVTVYTVAVKSGTGAEITFALRSDEVRP